MVVQQTFGDGRNVVAVGDVQLVTGLVEVQRGEDAELGVLPPSDL